MEDEEDFGDYENPGNPFAVESFGDEYVSMFTGATVAEEEGMKGEDEEQPDDKATLHTDDQKQEEISKRYDDKDQSK